MVSKCRLVNEFALLVLAYITLVPAVTASDPNIETASIDRVDSVMWFDPDVKKADWRLDLSDAPVDLWMKALRRDDVELQCMAIDTFVVAHQRNMEGLDGVVDELVRLLSVEDQSPEIVRSAVKALIEFQVKDQATLLAAISEQRGPLVAAMVDPALARWKSDSALEAWRKRLDDANTPRRMLIQAIRGVAALERVETADSLQKIIRNVRRSASVRLAAATAMGQVQKTGLEEFAESLIDTKSPSLIDDLTAIRLLAEHRSKKTVSLLSVLAGRKQTAVQAAAMSVLFEIAPKHLLEYVDDQLSNPDVNVRRLIARSLVQSRDQEQVANVASLLDDVNPALRREMAESLIDLANDEALRDEVIQQTVEVLGRESWRGCEQATIVLVNLEHKECSDRLVQLIYHDRGEVMVTAAWGLRRFAVKRHLPKMLDRAKEVYQGFRSRELSVGTNGAQELVAQLFMSFGQMKFQPADALMRQYIPKQYYLGDEARSAAAWALGYLYENAEEGSSPEVSQEKSKELTKMLVARLTDIESDFPEVDDVRRMSAVSLGRTQSASAIQDLRRFSGRGYGVVSQACDWSISRITGEAMPEFKPVAPKHHVDWFLTPVDQP